MSAAAPLDPKRVHQKLKPFYLGLLLSVGLSSLVVWLSAQEPVKASPTGEELSVIYSSLAFGACLLGMVLSNVLLKPKKTLKSGDPEGAVMRAFLLSWFFFQLAALIAVLMVFITHSDEHCWSLLTLSALTTLSHPPHEGRVKRALGVR